MIVPNKGVLAGKERPYYHVSSYSMSDIFFHIYKAERKQAGRIIVKEKK